MTNGFKNRGILLAGGAAMALIMGCMTTDGSKSESDESLALSLAGDSSGHGPKGKTSICHIPPGNPGNMHTITVGNPAVAAHLAHGDKLGRCEDVSLDKKPCPDGSSKASKHRILGSKLASHKAAICHIPPGNPANAHTIIVGLPAVKAHLAHGDKLGFCADPGIIDCGGGGGDNTGGGGGIDTTGGDGDNHTGGGGNNSGGGTDTTGGGGTNTTGGGGGIDTTGGGTTGPTN
ncbi:MAG: large protein [Fibrobacteres bacterium]|nr:large protein [Fibrobacterota bacterium]